MSDHLSELISFGETPELSTGVKNFLIETCSSPSGPEKRKFTAEVAKLSGRGGQRRAEREPGRDRKTVRKGTEEPESGSDRIGNFSGRGRKRAEEHLPDLLQDIKEIVEPLTQADPAFRTTRLCTPLTAAEVRDRLVQDKNIKTGIFPKVRTIQTKLNEPDYHRDKVKKSRPLKKSERQMPYLKMSAEQINRQMDRRVFRDCPRMPEQM